MPRRRNYDQRMAAGRCDASVKRTWNMICSGEYPEDMADKYGGYLLNDGEPYSVFSMEKKQTHYLIFFRSETIANCKTLEFVNSTFFRCFGGVGKPKPLSYPRSKLSCVNYSFRMTDELVSYCTTRYLPSNEFSAILYAEYEEKVTDNAREHNCSSFLNMNVWLLLVIVIISLFIIIRLR
ncbi:uncharacterized protein LOC117571561 [Drosophila albomicans]|uniref:Uncharacterized protein LOC117571561 n=1 Tax=Drosophila albomicans TaxID=7291 RepID=A0A6P8X0P9_DROAB|nr:uncharacterized protein LOC117571561 [Drosophila albomicans]